jgi:hypothetical protein
MNQVLPSFVRVSTVDSYITADPAFAGKLSPRETIVRRRDGTEMKFPKEVVEITQRMVTGGFDPIHAGKAAILSAASSFFNLPGSAAPLPPVAPEATAAPNASKAQSAKGEVNWNFSIWSLLISAQELSTKDRSDGSEKRNKKLREITLEYRDVS